MDKRTPLYDRHIALGGRMVSFAGYEMPVQYAAGVVAEHMAVRQRAGLFDVSHMGEFELAGPDAFKNLQRLLTNDFTTLKDGGVRYTLMLNERGGVLDDLLVYRLSHERYMLVVNASNRESDFACLRAGLTGDAALKDLSDATGLIALQGPRAQSILEPLCDPSAIPPKNYTFTPDVTVSGLRCLLSRTGYTGEDGFELYCDARDTPTLWDALLAAGGDELLPCGLGARDTLRLEAAMPLYGHEMDQTVTPLETGLDFAVKLGKGDFTGRAALEGAVPARQRIGLRVTGRGIAREGAQLYSGDKLIGRVTSGTQAPALGYPVAMALVDAGSVQTGGTVSADIRGRMVECEVVPLPFYKRQKC